MSSLMQRNKERLITELRRTPIVQLACQKTNVSRATYYRWRKDNETFADTCDEAIEESAGKINDMAESQLISSIKDKNMTAIIFWLKHHHPVYEARLRLDGRITHESEVLTPEQEELVGKALAMAGLLPQEVSKDSNKENSDEQSSK